MNIKAMFCMITSLCFIGNGYAAHIINLFLRPYPQIINQETIQHIEKKLKQPGQLSKYTIKRFFQDPVTAGIFSTYAGYITISTADGQITFPNKQTKPVLYLIITTRLTPITMAGSTIHHWELEEGTSVTHYIIERKQDEETKQFYWETQQTTLPNNKIIPATSICIIANPQKVCVPLGITLTKKSQNYLLPNIYVKKGIMKIANTLYMLNIKHFFASVRTKYKREKAHYLKQIL